MVESDISRSPAAEPEAEARTVVRRQAPAKLNLALAVAPANDAGMHPIRSWMVTIDLADELEVVRLPAGRLSRYAVFWHEDARQRRDIDWSITRDLAARSHFALERHTGRALPVQMKLAKRIPIGGGLGGGSSDAAAMLLATNELFELGLSMEELLLLAQEIGSDVPFFLHGGSALVRDLGETVTPQPRLPDLHAVVVLPESHCDTGAVYRRFDQRLAEGDRQDVDDITRLRTIHALAAEPETFTGSSPLFNDLAESACDVAPELGDLRNALAELAERPAHVSGSGSSLFIVTDDPLHAEALAGAVEDQLNVPAVTVRAMPGSNASPEQS